MVLKENCEATLVIGRKGWCDRVFRIVVFRIGYSLAVFLPFNFDAAANITQCFLKMYEVQVYLGPQFDQVLKFEAINYQEIL